MQLATGLHATNTTQRPYIYHNIISVTASCPIFYCTLHRSAECVLFATLAADAVMPFLWFAAYKKNSGLQLIVSWMAFPTFTREWWQRSVQRSRTTRQDDATPSEASKPANVAQTNESVVASAGGGASLGEVRDETVHSSQQKIKVVTTSATSSKMQAQLENADSEDDDELVE